MDQKGVSLSCLRAKGERHPGQVAHSLQKLKETNNHLHSGTYIQFKSVLGLWEEDGRILRRHMGRTQIEHLNSTVLTSSAPSHLRTSNLKSLFSLRADSTSQHHLWELSCYDDMKLLLLLSPYRVYVLGSTQVRVVTPTQRGPSVTQ